jgi:hypothetical protein
MKTKYWLVLLLVVSGIFAGVSCKSAPPPEPPGSSVPEPGPTPAPPTPAQPEGPAQASLEALQKAAARAEEARKRASDFECPSYFPSEWEAAEAQYEAATALPKTTGAEVDEAIASLSLAADTYDELFGKTIPLYAQAREDEIVAARDALAATGVTASFPEYLRDVDETAVSALKQYEEKDYYAARDTAAKALGMYQTLKLAADAWLARQEIVDRDFADRDRTNFAQADAVALDAVNAYNEGAIDSARKGAEEALQRYNQVLNAGWAAYAADLGEAARKARQNALNLKANVAVKDIFNTGEGFYQQAALALRASQYKEAAARYTESESRFVAAAQSALEKRRIAEETIREAEQTIEASDEAARQAEIIIQGGSI